MKRIFACAILLLSTGILCAAGPGRVTAEIVDSSPAGHSITVPFHEPVYFRIRFESDDPVMLWTRPLFHGKPVDAVSNPSIEHQGKGYALGWVSFSSAAKVDEIRIIAGGGKKYREEEVANIPFDIIADDHAANVASRPVWVDELRSGEAEISRQNAAGQSLGIGGSLFMLGFMLAVLAMLVASVGLPAWCYRKWDGGWKFASAIPLGIMGFVVLRIIAGVALDPTSHNLWPFEILFSGFISLGIIVTLIVVKRVSGRLF